jgi:predicted small secreted protein
VWGNIAVARNQSFEGQHLTLYHELRVFIDANTGEIIDMEHWGKYGI